MYLGTNEPALQVAKNLRDEEIQLASNYRRARSSRRTRHHDRTGNSRVYRITHPVRRSD